MGLTLRIHHFVRNVSAASKPMPVKTTPPISPHVETPEEVALRLEAPVAAADSPNPEPTRAAAPGGSLQNRQVTP